MVADYGIVSTSDAYARTLYAQKQPASTTTPVTTRTSSTNKERIVTVTGQKRKNPSTRSRNSKQMKMNNTETVISMLNEDDNNSDGHTDQQFNICETVTATLRENH